MFWYSAGSTWARWWLPTKFRINPSAVCVWICVRVCRRLPADSSVLEISWPVLWNPLSPDGLLGGFNSFCPPFFLWNIISHQTQREHLCVFLKRLLLCKVLHIQTNEELLQLDQTFQVVPLTVSAGRSCPHIQPGSFGRGVICLFTIFEFIAQRVGLSCKCMEL